MACHREEILDLMQEMKNNNEERFGNKNFNECIENNWFYISQHYYNSDNKYTR